MTYQEEFRAWKSANPDATYDQKKSKLLEIKANYSPESIGKNLPQMTTSVAGMDVSLPRQLSAKEKLEQYKNIPAGKRRQFMGMSVPGPVTETMETLFPRTTQSQVSGEGMGPASLVLDAMAAPQTGYIEGGASALSAAGVPIDKEKMREGMAYKALTSPELIPSALSGGMAGLASKTASPFMKVGAQGLSGMMGQAPFSYAEQMSQQEMGNDFSGETAGTEVATAGAISSFLPIVGGAVKEGFKQAKKGISGVTGTDVGTLQKVNLDPIKDKFSRVFRSKDEGASPNNILSQMDEAKKESTNFARSLIKEVDNFEKIYMTENPIVEEAAERMGNARTVDFLKFLDSKKKSAIIGNKLNKNAIRYNKEIDELTGQIQSAGSEIPFRDILTFRRDLDNSVNYKRFSESNPSLASDLQGLHKDFADHLRGSLVDAAKKTGNPEYISGMKKMSNKYDSYDRLKELVGSGKNRLAQLTRANNLLNKLEGDNSAIKKEALEDISELIGNKYLDHAEMLELANNWKKAVNATGGDSRVLTAGSRFGAVPQVGAGAVGMMDLGEQVAPKLYGLQQQYQPLGMAQLREQEGQGTVLR